MPRRGRHRTALPAKLIAAAAALLVGGTAVFLGGTAFADSAGDAIAALTGQSSSDEGSGSGEDEASKGDGDDQAQGDEDGGSDDGGDQDRQGSRDEGDRNSGDDSQAGGDGQKAKDGEQPDEREKSADQKKADPFPGRDKASPPSDDDFVDIADVEKGDPGEGGRFTGGSYTVRCGTSDHNNSDNYMAAPGKENGAQHVHDYVGNKSTDGDSDDASLEKAGTSCANGDKSTFFWPVLRDLNGTGPDVGENGGSLDGNEGSILRPVSADLTFHGHGDLDEMQAMPQHLMMITGNAKAVSQDGKNANAKYTCTGFTDRATTKYPICPSGQKLMRILDYPSCWDGENLESKDLRSHMAFADADGNCPDGKKPVPALRITLTYDQPAGRAFAIDSFPDQQHGPSTDHSDFESFTPPEQAKAGLDCIVGNRKCVS